jgi:hypothetical protein
VLELSNGRGSSYLVPIFVPLLAAMADFIIAYSGFVRINQNFNEAVTHAGNVTASHWLWFVGIAILSLILVAISSRLG